MPRVLLCGKSLFVACVRAILETAPQLDLRLVGPQPERIRKIITRWKPDVLILETGLLEGVMSLALLQDFPQMKLIGLDIEDHRLVVLTGSTSCEPTPEQLLEIIER